MYGTIVNVDCFIYLRDNIITFFRFNVYNKVVGKLENCWIHFWLRCGASIFIVFIDRARP